MSGANKKSKGFLPIALVILLFPTGLLPAQEGQGQRGVTRVDLEEHLEALGRLGGEGVPLLLVPPPHHDNLLGADGHGELQTGGALLAGDGEDGAAFADLDGIVLHVGLGAGLPGGDVEDVAVGGLVVVLGELVEVREAEDEDAGGVGGLVAALRAENDDAVGFDHVQLADNAD